MPPHPRQSFLKTDMTTPISKKFFLTILAIFLLGRLLLMWFVPLAEPSEARYAVMCKNMADSGNFLEHGISFCHCSNIQQNAATSRRNNSFAWTAVNPFEFL